MGFVLADIQLKNPRLPELKPMTVSSRVDTGAITLCIPEHVVLQLQLEAVDQREIMLADGRKQKVPYVGPIEVAFENRKCFVGALVLGDEVLLGAVLIGDMDVLISPTQRKLIVNPDSPNFAQAIVK
jgi:clan AA aspartic protease